MSKVTSKTLCAFQNFRQTATAGSWSVGYYLCRAHANSWATFFSSSLLSILKRGEGVEIYEHIGNLILAFIPSRGRFVLRTHKKKNQISKVTWWVSLQLIDRLTWRCHSVDRGDTVQLEDYVKDIKAIQTMAPMWACDIFYLWLQFYLFFFSCKL